MNYRSTFSRLTHLAAQQGARIKDVLESQSVQKIQAGTRKTIKILSTFHSQINSKATGPFAKTLQWFAFTDTLVGELLPDSYNNWFTANNLVRSHHETIGAILLDRYLHNEDAKWENIEFKFNNGMHTAKLSIVHI